MMCNAKWQIYDQGKTVGQRGSENGLIMLDESHVDGARITLERNGHIPFAITCGIYGWMVHTRFFSSELEARQAFAAMKIALEEILDLIPNQDDPDASSKMDIATDRIQKFVEDFP